MSDWLFLYSRRSPFQFHTFFSLHYHRLLLSFSFTFTNMSSEIDHLSSLLLSNLILFCSFIFSHPLYLSYFIFFSPYLFKILSFLSPLFITTFLLLLSLFTLTSPLGSNSTSLLLTTYQSFVERFKSDIDDVALQVYEIVFENPDEETSDLLFVQGVKSFGEFLEEKDVFEDFPQVNYEKSGVEQPIITTKESKEEMKKNSIKKSEEKVGIDNSKAIMLNSSPRGIVGEDVMGPVNLGSFGSMRREKEWTRTLACKLFEERHTAAADVGGEGMDLLWETYEADTSKKKGNNLDEEDEEFEPNGQFCCLQAFKLSAGKMHLGMRTPNLIKISKALKGIGWLHQVSSRHGKKKGYR